MPKRMPSATYYHVSCAPASALARIRSVVPNARFTVVRVDKNGSLAALDYPGFDTEDIPVLARSIRISPDGTLLRRSYSGDSAPVLHRKELLIAPTDPRYAGWKRKTEALERAGAFKDTLRIGTRRQWQEALKRVGLKKNPDPISFKTAIRRNKLSVPMRALCTVLWKGCTLLDYGCGRGGDVARLRKAGVQITGYDPHYAPEMPKGMYDLVNLGYVLNVIESIPERAKALRQAWERARHGLLIAVRTGPPESNWKRVGDGHRTGSGTFQKMYKGSELVRFVREHVQGGRIYANGSGCVVVLRG